MTRPRLGTEHVYAWQGLDRRRDERRPELGVRMPDVDDRSTGGRPRLCVMLPRADGHGGISHTVINLANHLIERFDIQLVGLLRARNQTVFDIDPRIDVRHVVDIRPYGPDGERRDLEQGGVDEHGEPVSR